MLSMGSIGSGLRHNADTYKLCGRVVRLLHVHRCCVWRHHQLWHQLSLGVPRNRNVEEVHGDALSVRMDRQHRAEHLRNMAADRVKRSQLHHIENHRGCFCSSVLELSSTTHIRIPRQSCERIEYFI